MIVGLQHWRKLPASGDNEFAVQPQQLAVAVAADLQAGLIPFYFLGTIGECRSCCWWCCSCGGAPAARNLLTCPFFAKTFTEWVGWRALVQLQWCVLHPLVLLLFCSVVVVQAPPAAVQSTPSLSWLTSACSESQLTVGGPVGGQPVSDICKPRLSSSCQFERGLSGTAGSVPHSGRAMHAVPRCAAGTTFGCTLTRPGQAVLPCCRSSASGSRGWTRWTATASTHTVSSLIVEPSTPVCKLQPPHPPKRQLGLNQRQWMRVFFPADQLSATHWPWSFEGWTHT